MLQARIEVNAMFGRKNLLSHLESPITPLGVILGLMMAAYLLLGMMVLGLGAYVLGACLLSPIVLWAAYMAFADWRNDLAKYPRIAVTLGIIQAVVVVASFVYAGVLFARLSGN